MNCRYITICMNIKNHGDLDSPFNFFKLENIRKICPSRERNAPFIYLSKNTAVSEKMSVDLNYGLIQNGVILDNSFKIDTNVIWAIY